jgi:hypothetical protein
MQVVAAAVHGRVLEEASQQVRVAQVVAVLVEMVTRARTSQEVPGQLT